MTITDEDEIIPRRRQPAPRQRTPRLIVDKDEVSERIKARIAPVVEQIPRIIGNTQLPNIQQIRILRDADVYDTPALIKAKRRIAEIMALPRQTGVQQTEVKKLRGLLADRKYKQRVATEKRRDAIPVTNININFRPDQLIAFKDIDMIKTRFSQFEGLDITIAIKLANGDRLVRHLRYFKRNFFNDIFDGFLGNIIGSDFVVRSDFDGLYITPNNVLPANKTWTQTYRDSTTHTCVQDSLISLLDPAKKNDKTMINKLTKLKLQFPHGMTESEIQEYIVTAFSLPIDIKIPLPIADLNTTLRPASSQSFRKLTLVNTRPSHVEPLKTIWTDLKFTDYTLFNDVLRPRLASTLYSVVAPSYFENPSEIYQQYVFQDGIMTYTPPRPIHVKTFQDQYLLHTSMVDINGVNDESPMVDYQSLEFLATPVYIKESNTPVQELDMNRAYTSYPHPFAGYLIAFEDGIFSQDQFDTIKGVHENDWTTVYWDIQITHVTPLHVVLNLPERIVCPTWFITSVLKDTSFVIFRYEVRKSFNMIFDEGLPKKEYVKLFGKTAQHPRRNNYQILGEHKPEFYKWIQSKLDDSRPSNIRTNIRQSIFEGEDPIYTVSAEGKTRRVCPQILNSVSLWCFSQVFEIAKTVPIDTILGKTLDSIILSRSIPVPDLFKEKIHQFFNKESNAGLITGYTHIEFCAKEYFPINREPLLKTPFQHVNVDIGPGGSGKTHHRMSQTPYGILAVPTHELIDAKKIEYPDRSIITHHQLAGWLCTKRENVRVAYVDELTMISQTSKEDIVFKQPNATLFFMGDIDEKTGIPFQIYNSLTPYTIENVFYHNTDYRSKDEKTKVFKEKLRQRLRSEFRSYFYSQYSNIDDILDEFAIQRHTFDPSLPILTATRWLCDYYTEQKHDALNCHRVQGKTLDKVFQIDLTTMSHQAFYTCVSRCTQIDDIRFVIASNKQDARWEFRGAFLENLIEK